MELRSATRCPFPVSAVGLGTWQLGADWGAVTDADSTAILRAADEAGVRVFDTADVYGDGRSEQTIGRYLADRSRERPEADRIAVFTKMGRRAEQLESNYVLDNFRAWNDRSRANLGVDTLDLVQLHCPPDEVFASDAVFDALDTMVAEGRMRAYGVSVETCEQALTAIARPRVASVQIILNAFRQKPLDEVLPAAASAGVAVIARVPLASGLLSGRFDHDTTFAAGDHRNYNRHGEAFDVGETFAGVPYDEGVEAAKAFSAIANSVGLSPIQLALRWILDQPGVTTVIPGASSVSQAQANAATDSLAPLQETTLRAVGSLYDERIRPLVHDRW
ncbi:aldo/keto reductase [Jatrophihabitans telluris]|uniref:Aldo/keto reductase n=1 Tax=Jatrophihabitans telluris TaxID=2038343 RepID=A0ABY4QXY1_9ACTN|nr:aldo/keto reductase [Jatrophihabitans telluris]UQX87831.1 aldo/keto reductase [Jatrophihabitans telluris]